MPAVAVGLLAFLLYGLTAAPSLGPGHDSGELAAAAYSLGVAHPPGYPLYVRLAHLWGALPWPGDYGFRLNLFSGAGVAWAAACLTWLLSRATGSVAAGLVAGLGFACLRSVWRQAVIAEVFGLHLALLASLAAVAWLTAQRIRENRPYGKWLWLVYALLGACVAHHHTFLLAGPGLLWLARRHLRAVLLTPAWLAFLLLPLAFYVDMLWRARGGPALNWGGIADGSDLLAHILRRAYGTFQLSARVAPLESGLVHTAGYGLFTSVQQAAWPWMALALWGTLTGWRKHRDLWGLGLAWTLLLGAFFALIGRQGTDAFHLDLLERFYAGSYLGVAVLAGIAAADCTAARPRLGVALALALCGWTFGRNLQACRLDGRELALSYGRQLLASCPPRALLLVNGDLPVGVVDYLRVVQRERLDVDMVCPGLLGAQWYRQQLPARVRGWLPAAEASEKVRLQLLASRALAAGCPVLSNQKHDWPGRWVARSVAWEYGATDSAVADLRRLVAEAATLRPGLGEEARFWPRFLLSTRIAGLRQGAAQVYARDPHLALAAMELLPELGARRALDYINLGLLHMQLGRFRSALGSFEAASAIQPAMSLPASLRAETELHLVWQELGEAAAAVLE